MTTRIAWTILLSIAAHLALAEGARAQSLPIRSLAPTKERATVRSEVPETHRPPPGMCRVWLDNVPAAQQPAPTDCASAIRNRPSNGRVIFAESDGRTKRDPRDERRDERDARGESRDGKPRKPPQ